MRENTDNVNIEMVDTDVIDAMNARIEELNEKIRVIMKKIKISDVIFDKGVAFPFLVLLPIILENRNETGSVAYFSSVITLEIALLIISIKISKNYGKELAKYVNELHGYALFENQDRENILSLLDVENSSSDEHNSEKVYSK